MPAPRRQIYERMYGKPSDWWNVGILINEMLTAANPLRGDNRKESEYLSKYKELQLPPFMSHSRLTMAPTLPDDSAP